MPTSGAAAQDPLEVDGRRRVAPDDDHAQARRPAARRGERWRRPRRRRAGSPSAIGPPSRSRAREDEAVKAGLRPGSARAVRRAPTSSRVSAARRSTSWSSSSTRAVMSCSNSASPTDGRLTRTLAAAPRAAASPSSEATLRSLEALTLLRPASASAVATRSTQASTQRRGTSEATRAADWRAAVRAARLVVGLARHLHRGTEPGVGLGVLVGEGQEPIREREAGLGRPGVEVGVLGVLRAALRTGPRPSPRDSPRARPPTAEALPPPGTGAADPSAAMNPSSVRSRKRDPAVVWSIPRLYGCGSASVTTRSDRAAHGFLADTPHRRSHRVGAGAGAVPARPPRATDMPDARREGPASGPAPRGPQSPAPMLWSVRPRGAGPLRRGRSPSSGAIGAGRSATAWLAGCRLRRASAAR